MIDFPVLYQAVIFGNFATVEPNSETIKYFMKNLKNDNYIPVTSQVMLSNGIIKDQLMLKTDDNSLTVEFSSERIDLKYINQNPGTSEQFLSNDFIIKIEDIIQIILKRYPINSYRLAFLSHNILKNTEKEIRFEIYKKLFTTIKFYSESEPNEWSQRFNYRKEEEFNGKSELLNHIFEISRVKGKLKDKDSAEEIDRILLKFDINTNQLSTEYKYEITDIVEYFRKAISIEQSIISEYSKLMELL